MANNMYYWAEMHIRTRKGELITLYHDHRGPAGIPAHKWRAIATAAVLAQEPGGKVVGSRVTCS